MISKVQRSNYRLPTSSLSWMALRIINYSLKCTVEVLSTSLRPREEGKLRDPVTYKLLTPRPGRLSECSQKSLSQTSHLDFVSVTSTCAVIPGAHYSPSFHHIWGRVSDRRAGEMSATEDG